MNKSILLVLSLALAFACGKKEESAEDNYQPGGGEAARGCARRLDLLGSIPDLGPGLGRVVDVKAGLLEDVLVVIEDRRGRVVGERQHGAVRL